MPQYRRFIVHDDLASATFEDWVSVQAAVQERPHVRIVGVDATGACWLLDRGQQQISQLS